MSHSFSSMQFYVGYKIFWFCVPLRVVLSGCAFRYIDPETKME